MPPHAKFSDRSRFVLTEQSTEWSPSTSDDGSGLSSVPVVTNREFLAREDGLFEPCTQNVQLKGDALEC